MPAIGKAEHRLWSKHGLCSDLWMIDSAWGMNKVETIGYGKERGHARSLNLSMGIASLSCSSYLRWHSRIASIFPSVQSNSTENGPCRDLPSGVSNTRRQAPARPTLCDAPCRCVPACGSVRVSTRCVTPSKRRLMALKRCGSRSTSSNYHGPFIGNLIEHDAAWAVGAVNKVGRIHRYPSRIPGMLKVRN